MNFLRDDWSPDPSVEHLMQRVRWTRDIVALMTVVITAAAGLITLGTLPGLFEFPGTLPIYVILAVIWLARWLVQRGYWRWAALAPIGICYGLAAYASIDTGYHTYYVIFYALAVWLAGMLLGSAGRWLVTLVSIAAYVALGQHNEGGPLIDSLDRVITFTFSLLGVAFLQAYYHSTLQQIFLIQVQRNETLASEIVRRKRAEEALRDQGEQLRRLAQNTSDLVTETDAEGKIRYISPSYYPALGYWPNDLLGTNAYDLVHPQDIERVQESARLAMIKGRPNHVQALVRHHSGHYIPFEVYGTPLVAEDGAFQGFVLSARDISQQKEAEAALLASEAKFRAIIESLPLGVHMFSLRADDALVFTGYNPAAEEILGISLDNRVNQPIEKAFPAWCAGDLCDQFRHIARHGGSWQQPSMEYCDGNRQVLLESTLFQTSPGRVVMVFSDVTERVRAAEVLRQSEEKFSTAFMISPDSININRLVDGMYIDVNQGFMQLTGYSREEVVGRTSLELNIWDDPADRARLVQALQDHGVVKNLEATFRRKNGERALGMMSAQVMSINGEMCILSITRDMTERIEAQRALQAAHNQLEAAYDATLEGWARALDLRERDTASHSRRVVNLTLRVARAVGFSEEELVHIRRGALLHDIGKLGVPDQILLKPGPLSPEEWTLMRQHPVFAKNLLEDIPYLRPSLPIPYGHHEHWDGSGYPQGLAREDIPLPARIFAVIDEWDALISDRPYRKAWTAAQARRYLLEQSGRLFDPHIVAIFLKEIEDGFDPQTME